MAEAVRHSAFLMKPEAAMTIYFAPLEGLTDAVYRRVHASCFSGVEKYFIPFVSPTSNLAFNAREMRAVSPESNDGINAVPQLLTRDAEHFLWAAQALADMGYREVNLNLGCPSGTVTAKGKGSGFLRDPDGLRTFLDAVYAKSPIPVSIKTRIGYESPDEWPVLLDIFAAYPVHETIIHPRTRVQMYKGTPYAECYDAAIGRVIQPVYNGDLFTAADCRALMERQPSTTALMLGRGLIANPALAQELHGGESLTHDMIRRFHDELYRAYSYRYPKNVVLGRMREAMKYISCCFDNAAKARKAMRKAQYLDGYLDAAGRLMALPLKERPGFDPEEV